MLAIDIDNKFDDPIVQTYWRNGEIPHFSGVTIGDGNVVIMGEQVIGSDDFCESHIYPVVASKLSSFMEFSGEFVSITEMVNRVYIAEIDCYAICGEGQMGNEGFVALIKGGALIWSAFFTISNPFFEVKKIGNFIVAKSTHEIFWEFPIFEPWNARVLGPIFKNWES